MKRESKQIVLASAGAFIAAAALLVIFILPAEYGWDPLGSGQALGLLGMSESGDAALHPHSAAWQADRRSFQLAPFDAVEFKYRMEKGDVMLYQWRADGEVLFDMHAEPDGSAPGYAESFDKARGKTAAGSYTAPFSGIHGWFWQNRTQQDVTVELRTRGYYTSAKEFRDGREFDYGFGASDKGQP